MVLLFKPSFMIAQSDFLYFTSNAWNETIFFAEIFESGVGFPEGLSSARVLSPASVERRVWLVAGPRGALFPAAHCALASSGSALRPFPDLRLHLAPDVHVVVGGLP